MSRLNLACVQYPELFGGIESRNGNVTPKAQEAIAHCSECPNLAVCKDEVIAGVYEGSKGIIAGMTTEQRDALVKKPDSRTKILPDSALIKTLSSVAAGGMMLPLFPAHKTNSRQRHNGQRARWD